MTSPVLCLIRIHVYKNCNSDSDVIREQLKPVEECAVLIEEGFIGMCVSWPLLFLSPSGNLKHRSIGRRGALRVTVVSFRGCD